MNNDQKEDQEIKDWCIKMARFEEGDCTTGINAELSQLGSLMCAYEVSQRVEEIRRANEALLKELCSLMGATPGQNASVFGHQEARKLLTEWYEKNKD